jgi:transcription elongation factor GreA-like protein
MEKVWSKFIETITQDTENVVQIVREFSAPKYEKNVTGLLHKFADEYRAGRAWIDLNRTKHDIGIECYNFAIRHKLVKDI